MGLCQYFRKYLFFSTLLVLMTPGISLYSQCWKLRRLCIWSCLNRILQLKFWVKNYWWILEFSVINVMKDIAFFPWLLGELFQQPIFLVSSQKYYFFIFKFYPLLEAISSKNFSSSENVDAIKGVSKYIQLFFVLKSEVNDWIISIPFMNTYHFFE